MYRLLYLFKLVPVNLYWQAQSKLQLCWTELVFIFGFPVYVAAAPVYVAAAPVYVAAAPVYVAVVTGKWFDELDELD